MPFSAGIRLIFVKIISCHLAILFALRSTTHVDYLCGPVLIPRKSNYAYQLLLFHTTNPKLTPCNSLTPGARIMFIYYSKTCVKRPLLNIPNIGFQTQLSLNAGQKCCRMLQGDNSAMFSTFIKYHLSLRSLFCLFLSDRFTQL